MRSRRSISSPSDSTTYVQHSSRRAPSPMSAGLQQQQHSSLGAMSQTMMDLLYSLTNCIFCFPGSPKLKINNRSFKMQHLLGEVSPDRISSYCPSQTILTRILTGRLLLRLPSPRYLNLPTLRPQKDPMPIRARIHLPRSERSRSIHALLTTS